VLADLEAEPTRDRRLALLDACVHEFLHMPAVEAEDVVMVRTLVQLEDRHPVSEVMPRDETRRLELREHSIHRGETDVLAQLGKPSVDVLSREMTGATALEDVEDLHARERDLQSSLAQILAFHERGVPLGFGGQGLE